MTETVPVLETERMILRAHTQNDFEAFAAMRADPVIAKYTTGKPASLKDSWSKLLQYRGLWGILGYGYWAAEEKGTGRFIGNIGFGDFHRGLSPSIDGVPEAGWVLASWTHGRGFASEGAQAALRWLDTQTAYERCVCIIAPANQASKRLAQKLGFAFLTHTFFMEEDTLMFERKRSQENLQS
ncbi:GNAT family N-acetyltransferase [Kozakia baliensis]|uniref:GCN5 family acetyltransferase n=1 Tax=Kozakia baliensis TaxID=153496 RepID=A0A1D8UVG4_9PROT|nr:GNAT family N-acetyltransferase [Kozakia baliensis]AOX17618.1 GCN5 family acetyltransferase [Kozakia baliensis]GBR31207.1 N-acetyltransferase GCN5 [Kozakia baliensis NRIC 0488]GEL62897.1 N-acetyltransferase [Kozakia baliensis]